MNSALDMLLRNRAIDIPNIGLLGRKTHNPQHELSMRRHLHLHVQVHVPTFCGADWKQCSRLYTRICRFERAVRSRSGVSSRESTFMRASSAEWQQSHKLGRWRGGWSNKWRICRGVRRGGGRRRKAEE